MFTRAVLLILLTFAVGCGDNHSTYRQALSDLGVEMQEYAERCALDGWKVADYERLICDVDTCEVGADCDSPQPLENCTRIAPEEWSHEGCADALAVMACADFIALPTECLVLLPWERG